MAGYCTSVGAYFHIFISQNTVQHLAILPSAINMLPRFEDSYYTCAHIIIIPISGMPYLQYLGWVGERKGIDIF